MRRLTPLALLVAIATLAPGVAQAADPAEPPPQASLVDVEDEVMCPICGTLLQLFESPQAQRQRAFVRGLIATGKTKSEIKDALVVEYGRAVLALPGGSGFDLSAYLVPAIGFVLAAASLAGGIWRWRRTGGPTDEPEPGAARPRGEDAERLEQDLARYDL